ncbi:sensor histidine kinase [Paracidobacterium acidisoli]|nr:ATP-binding protein [Paracidobacterium acidisoli]MBT9332533.1 HAMP domain-containing protein [Paracidobacterium acidisoli]
MALPELDELVGILPEGQLIQIVGIDGRRLFPLDPNLLRDSLGTLICPAPSIDNPTVGNGMYRRLCRPVNYEGKPSYLVVSSSLLEDQTLLRSFTFWLFEMIPVLLAVSSLGGYSLSRRALKPVALLISEAQSITAQDLSRRLPVPQVKDELQLLAHAWNELLSRLEVAMRRVTQFTADASHELRNPIAYIRATAQFHSQNVDLDEISRDGFLEIMEEARRAGELLENLLLLARADVGQILPEVSDVDARPHLEAVCDRIEPLARAKNLSLVMGFAAADHPLILSIDVSHLRRLALILLDNAVKYTLPGGAIRIDCEIADGFHLQVSDTGIGIPQEAGSRIFDRFYRVDTSRADDNPGAGLGLAIAKWIVELYSGEITVQSDLGRGATFRVRLPQHSVSPAE